MTTAKETAERILKEVFGFDKREYILENIPADRREWAFIQEQRLTGKQADWTIQSIRVIKMNLWIHKDGSEVLLGFTDDKFRFFYAEVTHG